jgi:hypothetical protein
MRMPIFPWVFCRGSGTIGTCIQLTEWVFTEAGSPLCGKTDRHPFLITFSKAVSHCWSFLGSDVKVCGGGCKREKRGVRERKGEIMHALP